MSLGDFLLKRLAAHYKMQDAYSYLQITKRIGQPCKVDLPPDLLPMAGKMFTRALANQAAFEVTRDWVLPFWAERQFTPGDPAFIPRMGRAAFNLSHRNWTAVGNLGSTREITVDPRGLITPWFEAWSLDFWLVRDDRPHFPSRAGDAQVRQRALEQLPIIETAMDAGPVVLTTEVLATKIKKIDAVMVLARITNGSDQVQTPRLVMSIRPYNPEGVVEIKSIEFTAEDLFAVNGKIGVLCQEAPTAVFCCDFRTGDCSYFLDRYENKDRADCPVGLASAFADYGLRIEPGAFVDKLFIAPAVPLPNKPRTLKALRRYDPDERRNSSIAQWRRKAEEGMQISLPDKEIEAAFNLHKSYLNLFDDVTCITPGVSLYHHYWFRDSAYLVAALDKMGYPAQAKKKLQNYPRRQKRDGFFLSQDGEWDSNGQAIWTLVEHFRMTRDRSFLAKMFPSICKGAHWIHNKTRETTQESSPHIGLLPAGMSAEHFGPNDYFYWDDFWGLAGLRDAAYAAETLGHRDIQQEFQRFYRQLHQSVHLSLAHVERRLGKKVMTAGPYRRFDSAAIGSICVVHPLKLMSPFDEWVKNSAEMLREQCFYQNGFFQDMTHAGVNIYLSLHVAQIYAAQQSPVAWEIARHLLSLATQAGTWPEAVNVNTGGGCMGDGMHGWATADFLLFVRNTLLDEEGDRLLITPCIPPEWTDWGKTIEVKNAPTHFGDVSFRIEGREKELVLTLDANWRQEPAEIEWVTRPLGARMQIDQSVKPIGPEGILFSASTRQVRIGNEI